MRLDRLAVKASRSLTHAGVPHALIKGVTTARWLYDPPRAYRDVDLLVPRSRIKDAIRALKRDGVAEPKAGRLGEEASHSQVLISSEGYELDMHVTLPTLATPTRTEGDRLWAVLEPHVQPFDLDGEQIPALDLPARFVVLVMHWVASSHDVVRVVMDKDLALGRLTPAEFLEAHQLAQQLGVGYAFRPAVSAVAVDEHAPAEMTLRLKGGSPAEIRLKAILAQPVSRWPKQVLMEIFPSPTMLSRQNPGQNSLPLLYLRRWRWLVRETRIMLEQRADLRRSGNLSSRWRPSPGCLRRYPHRTSR
jgi:hypothetical protein